MGKLILHTIRYRAPLIFEFNEDELGVAVTMALEGACDMQFSYKKITDKEGNLILDRDGIIEYAITNNL